MKRFNFSFQYLLDAHQAREQAAEHALHTVMKEQAVVRQTLKNKTAFRSRQVAVLQSMEGSVNRMDYAAYLRSIDTVRREIEELHDSLTEFEQRINACRETLKQEMTARKVMENLSEREREEWAFNMQVEEQKQMDELAVGRWSRQARKI